MTQKGKKSDPKHIHNAGRHKATSTNGVRKAGEHSLDAH